MSKTILGPPPKFSEITLPKPQPFKKEVAENIEPVPIDQINEKRSVNDIPIIRKPSSGQPELRKLKVSRPSFDPTEGVDFENFSSKKEAFLMGYLNALYHRLDGVKRIK